MIYIIIEQLARDVCSPDVRLSRHWTPVATILTHTMMNIMNFSRTPCYLALLDLLPMTPKTQAIGRDSVAESVLFKATLAFWFHGGEHLRSPFPAAWHDTLRERTLDRFHAWLNALGDDARHAVNDTMVGEKLEELLFQAAGGMATSEEERLTILYPFLPRPGDPIVKDGDGRVEPDSVVVSRALQREGKDAFLEITAKGTATGEEWKTRFELP
jgi:hypothetical protein